MEFFKTLGQGDTAAQYAAVIDMVIPILLLINGVKFLRKPPKFGGMKGFNTKYTSVHNVSWDFAHKLGGTLYVVEAIILGLICLWKYETYSIEEPKALTIAYTLLVIAFIFLPLLPVHFICKKRYKADLEKQEQQEKLWVLRMEKSQRTGAYEFADSVGMRQAADKAESEANMGKKMEYTDDRDVVAEAETETAAETEEKTETNDEE